MSLDCGRTPEYPERTHAITGKTSELHTERPVSETTALPYQMLPTLNHMKSKTALQYIYNTLCLLYKSFFLKINIFRNDLLTLWNFLNAPLGNKIWFEKEKMKEGESQLELQH